MTYTGNDMVKNLDMTGRDYVRLGNGWVGEYKAAKKEEKLGREGRGEVFKGFQEM